MQKPIIRYVISMKNLQNSIVTPSSPLEPTNTNTYGLWTDEQWTRLSLSIPLNKKAIQQINLEQKTEIVALLGELGIAEEDIMTRFFTDRDKEHFMLPSFVNTRENLAKQRKVAAETHEKIQAIMGNNTK